MDQITDHLQSFESIITTNAQMLIGFLEKSLSLWQFVIIALTLFAAVILRQILHKRLKTLEHKLQLSPILHRVMQTVNSIAIPIFWVFGLWIGHALSHNLGQQTTMIRLIASLINAWVVIRLLSTFIPNPFIAHSLSWTVWGIAALHALTLLDPVMSWLDAVRFSSGAVNISLLTLIEGTIVTGVLLWIAAHSSGFIRGWLKESDAISPTMQVLLSKIISVILVFLSVLIGVQAVGIDLRAFAIFSGALGIGIGLGLQRVVANLVAGVTMLMDRSIKPGDVIEISTGDGQTYGTVTTLGARYVSVRAHSGIETLIPNELLITNPVTNWSYSDTNVRRHLIINIAYESDAELAMKLCVEAAATCDRVLSDPEPSCTFYAFGESAINLKLKFWVDDPYHDIEYASGEVLLAVWKAFRAHGILIPFAQRDLHIKSFPEGFNVSGPKT